MTEKEFLITKDDLDNIICIDETQLKEDIRNLIWILKTVKIDIRLLINEFESLERLVEYSEFEKFDGDMILKKQCELEKENEKLKGYNKSQELEIVRLHKLADAMSGVLKELGVYDVYDEEQINSVKEKLK